VEIREEGCQNPVGGEKPRVDCQKATKGGQKGPNMARVYSTKKERKTKLGKTSTEKSEDGKGGGWGGPR